MVEDRKDDPVLAGEFGHLTVLEVKLLGLETLLGAALLTRGY